MSLILPVRETPYGTAKKTLCSIIVLQASAMIHYSWYSAASSSSENAELSIRCDTLFAEEYVVTGDNDASAQWTTLPEGYCVYSREWQIRTHFKQGDKLRSLRLCGRLPSAVTAEDSLRISIYGRNDNLLCRVFADSITDDTLFHTSFMAAEPQLTLRMEVPACENLRRKKKMTGENESSEPLSAEYNILTGYLQLPDFTECRYTYYLYDSSGKLLRCFEDKGNLIDAGMLPAGVYLLKNRSSSCRNRTYRFVSP